MSPSVRSIALSLVAALAAATVVFLLASDFLTAWDGRLQAVANASDTPAVRVLVAESDGEDRYPTVPRAAIEGLTLRVDPSLRRSVDDAPGPLTNKGRFQLSFLVDRDDGPPARYPTTSTRSLGLAALAFVVVIVLRNMIFGGSPIAVDAAPAQLPAPLPPAGQVQPAKGPRPKKGPPPPRPGGRR
jgi:hypothetical protein